MALRICFIRFRCDVSFEDTNYAKSLGEDEEEEGGQKSNESV